MLLTRCSFVKEVMLGVGDFCIFWQPFKIQFCSRLIVELITVVAKWEMMGVVNYCVGPAFDSPTLTDAVRCGFVVKCYVVHLRCEMDGCLL